MTRPTLFTLFSTLIVAGLIALPLFAAPGHEKKAGESHAKVGQTAPAFTLTDKDGKEVSLSDYKGKLVVLHWQSVSCPWDVGYQPFLSKTAEQFAKPSQEGQVPVVFLGINSNKTESYKDIAKYNEKVAIPYAILKDPGNKVADMYGARTTPHMYIINPDGVLVYKGGIEEAPRSPRDVTTSETQYLVPALAALVEGSEPPHAETRSKGCTIKRE